MSTILVRRPTPDDIKSVVEISSQKRRNYEEEVPHLWKQANNANILEEIFFRSLLSKNSYIFLVAERKKEIIGFVIGKKIYSMGIYDPGGITILINDFCIDEEEEWQHVGKKLLEAITDSSKNQGVASLLITSGHHDMSKNQLLNAFGLKPALEWYCTPLTKEENTWRAGLF